MRGVHLNNELNLSESQGSSPHARGPHELNGGWQDTEGIIPACAGSTPSYRLAAVVSRDHPRMRGVHWIALWAAAVPEGSSPHARGPLL